jgi:UDP-N-acetylglucosamine 2-epimerase (non-hydrolysing)
MVQGDTASTFCVLWGCFLNKTPCVHLEAGMRTGSKYSPFPEEINRRTSSCIADIHICWTDVERDNLIKEGFYKKNIYVTGNTLIDTLLNTVKHKVDLDGLLKNRLLMEKIKSGAKIILVTQHRRENFGKKHEEIFRSIKEILKKHKEYIAVYPVHLNPKVKSLAEKTFKNTKSMFLVKPLSYVPFAHLMAKSSVIISDSGGLQEEAPSLGVPVLITRENTERPLVVKTRKAFLVGADRKKIIASFERVNKKWNYRDHKNPYGDGKSSKRVVKVLLSKYSTNRHKKS